MASRPRLAQIDPTDIGDGEFLKRSGTGWVGAAGTAPAVLAVSATGDTTETLATDQLINLMTLTPGAGNYVVMFSAPISHSAQNGTLVLSVYVNAVQVSGSEKTVLVKGNRDLAGYIHKITGVGAGQAVEMRWRNTFGSGNTICGNRSFTLLEVA